MPFHLPLFVPWPLLAIGAVVYAILCLGRWKLLLVFVALNVALFLWFVQMVAAAHNAPGAGDGIFVALIIAVPAMIVAVIRAVVLLATSR